MTLHEIKRDAVYETLTKRGPMTAPALAAALAMPGFEVVSLLTALAADGLIACHGADADYPRLPTYAVC